MNGYVRNSSPIWRHAMKRSVGPGERIPLIELYEQYGLKHGIEEGKPFIDWLRSVKLKDVNVWEIKYEANADETIEEGTEKEVVRSEKVPTRNESRQILKKDSPSNAFLKDNTGTIDEVVNLSVRAARERLPRLVNIKVLKYSLNQISKLSNKDTLCRMVKRRIQELELTSKL